MKTTNRLLFAVALTATISFANSVVADVQFKPVGDDGIAASPKVRQMLNETRVRGAHIAVVATTAPAAIETQTIFASPKVRQTFPERSAQGASMAAELGGVSYNSTGSDGITASPKLRQQLNDTGTSPIIIAPLK
jgi:hypothetical protein